MASNFNSHKHRKFNRYTASPSHKKGFSPYWFILLAAVLAVIVALLLGTLLGEIADTAPKGESTDAPPKTENPPLLQSDQIKGICVTLAGITDNTAQNVREQIPDGASAVSMTLFDQNGDPYYHSDVAEAFGKKSGELTLQRAFEGAAVGDTPLYTSVIFPSTALNNTDKAKEAVLNAYEAALIEELMLAGAHDVVITPFALGNESYKIDEAFAARLLSYVKQIRAVAPSIRIGIALPLRYLSDSEYAMLVEDISKLVDFIALDLTSKTDVDDFRSAINAASLNILRRSARLLICQTSAAEVKILTDQLEKYSMTNYQIAKK